MSSQARKSMTQMVVVVGACILAICVSIGLLQPALDRVFSGGTGIATGAVAEETDLLAGSTDAAGDSTEHAGGTDPNQAQDSRQVFQDDPLASLALALQRKQRELEERTNFLDEKEARLELLQADLHKQFDQLEREREQLRVGTEVLEGRQKSQRDKAVKKWFAIFQTMKPEPAAAVLESLEDSVAREVLSRLDSRKASKILDSMSPERSVVLVGDGLQKGNL